MEYFTTDPPVTVFDVTLIPVVRICTYGNGNGNKTGYWLSGNKEPLAIINCNASGVRVFNMKASEMPLDSLLQNIPDLNEVLAPYWQHEDD